MAAVTENSIKATIREEVGKGSARRARREGLVPAVLYGHKLDSVHLDLPGHDIFLIVKDSANAVITVNYGSKKQLALVKHIQRHPVRRNILHIDLLAVSAKERVEVEVPILLVGELAPGVQMQQEEFSLVISAPAISIPEHIEVSIEGLTEGAVVRVSDLTLPEGVEVNDELLERDILSVNAITENAEEEAEEVADAEAAVEAAV
ncbi:50S ribosomal protein L25/general stress protein Ctc [Actinomyces minihominis]|uniref:50S ribosomal protein L25/general stress protein Ctc n=1 Tax=Actinomyces minihominis TaxID=2002838 RepID=UPI000C07333E|nr:50S ribosomal protein L25/general stress protein Ctc [Actinomyces minihominis]